MRAWLLFCQKTTQNDLSTNYGEHRYQLGGLLVPNRAIRHPGIKGSPLIINALMQPLVRPQLNNSRHPAPRRVLPGHGPQLRPQPAFLKPHVRFLLPERGPVLLDDPAGKAFGRAELHHRHAHRTAEGFGA